MNRFLRVVTPLAVGVWWASLVAAGDGWSPAQMWSKTASGTKRAMGTTVDLLTLKPLRRKFSGGSPKSDLGLGFKPDPRKKPASSVWPASWFGPSQRARPQTVEDFFSQDRPR